MLFGPRLLASAFLAVVLSTTGCLKPPEDGGTPAGDRGPIDSRTDAQKIVGKWKVVQIGDNPMDVLYMLCVEFRPDGTGTVWVHSQNPEMAKVLAESDASKPMPIKYTLTDGTLVIEAKKKVGFDNVNITFGDSDELTFTPDGTKPSIYGTQAFKLNRMK